jgi:SAM-dependent methyltransferase
VGGADRVLDIGCGTGQTTRAAARRAPAGHALGLDLSAPQLARARALARDEAVTNVAFQQGDAQVHPLPAAGFDVAISRFGVMFFADPVAAFANVARALGRGGRLAFVCPQAAADQPWFTAPLAGLVEGEPEIPSPDDSGPGMFSLADPDRIVAVLGAAGFADVRPAPLATPMDFGPTVAAAVAFYLGSGPVRALLEERPELRGPARDRLEATLGRYLTPTGVRVPATHWLVTARRP